MDPERRLRQRHDFDGHPGAYVRARSRYPRVLIADLRELGGITPESRILEVGCGPGTLTQDLAPIGCEIVGIEIGPHLAETARGRLGAFPRVQIVTSSFEDWQIPSREFDLVIAAGSYHWLDPAVRVTKMLAALTPTGRIAIVNKHRVSTDDAELEADLRGCYARWDPEADPKYEHPRAADVKSAIDELLVEASLCEHELRHYPDEVLLSADRYRDLLHTYPEFNALSRPAQAGLADCLCATIEARCGGTFRMPLLCTLHIARKRLPTNR